MDDQQTPLSDREQYNLVTDTIAGPNFRLRTCLEIQFSALARRRDMRLIMAM